MAASWCVKVKEKSSFPLSPSETLGQRCLGTKSHSQNKRYLYLSEHNHSREGEVEVVFGQLHKLNMIYQTVSNNSLNGQLKTSDSIHATDVYTNLMKSS